MWKNLFWVSHLRLLIPAINMDYSIPTSPSIVSITWLSNYCPENRCKMIAHHTFDMHFSTTNELSISVNFLSFYFENYFLNLMPFFIEVSILLIYKNVFYILEINPLPLRDITDIFSLLPLLSVHNLSLWGNLSNRSFIYFDKYMINFLMLYV